VKMTKCKECGLENDHKMSCDTAFDEGLWNRERQVLEAEVEITVMRLANFMGCNSYTLPFSSLTVKVTPSDA
jgi:hypothetical protein